MKRKIFILIGTFIIFLIGILFLLQYEIRPIDSTSTVKEIFTVTAQNTKEEIIQKLKDQDFIREKRIANIILMIKGKQKIEPGGYYLSKNMNTLNVIQKIISPPDLKWIVIPEGLRKEQIGERLVKTLGWSSDELEKWNTIYTAMKFDYTEGVYFPDTYLIPVKENGLDIANRMINHFNEKFAPYFEGFAKKDIIWTTGLKLASIIQRETASQKDMPLISGILWNRLLTGTKLQVDATVQYARGKVGDNWWEPPTPNEIEEVDSLYNTYKYKGLPPRPICNPGLDAIDAALNPTETDCIFYLHDKTGLMHCSKTYEDHLKNIEKYLNN